MLLFADPQFADLSNHHSDNYIIYGTHNNMIY